LEILMMAQVLGDSTPLGAVAVVVPVYVAASVAAEVV
jgi:hypothetical protein